MAGGGDPSPTLAVAEPPEPQQQSCFSLAFLRPTFTHFNGGLLEEDGLPVRLGLGRWTQELAPAPQLRYHPPSTPTLESACCFGASNKHMFSTFHTLAVAACLGVPLPAGA